MEEEQLQEIFNEESNGENLTIQQTYEALCICGKNPIPDDLVSFFENEGIEAIDFEQFKALYEAIPDQTEDDLTEALKVFDKNDNGTVDKEELKAILQRRRDPDFTEDLDDDTIEEIFNAIDNFGDEDREGISDGFVSFRELARYLLANKTLVQIPSQEEQ